MLQLGAIAVVLIATTYRSFELDRFFVPKELTLHLTALIALLMAARSVRRMQLSWIDLLLIVYLVLSVLSALFATNVWLAGRAVAITASGLAVFWAARTVREAGRERALLNTLAIAIVIGALVSCLQAYGVRSDLFSLNRSPGGTLGNRNFVAHMAAFGLPLVLLAALRASNARTFALSTVGLSIVAGTLILTRSRAGWLAAAAVLFVWTAAFVVSRTLRAMQSRGRLAILVAMLGAGVVAAVFVPNSLRWRSDNPYLESMRGVANFQEGSGAGRLVQYRRSLTLAVRNPLFGAGPGNWSVKYPTVAGRRDPSMNNNEAGTTSNPWPSSDWVAFAAERGFSAAIILAIAFAVIGLRGLRQLLAARDLDTALRAAALLATAVAAIVAGLFDAVLMIALPTLLVWATLGALTPGGAQAPAFATPGIQRAAVLAVLLLTALGSLRSTSQLIGMGIYSTQPRNSFWLGTAARIDPGNYRLRMRLVARGRNQAQRCKHARAAHQLLPSAQQARAASRRCGD